MTYEKLEKLLKVGRNFLTFDEIDVEDDALTDQQMKLPQPPLTKGKMTEVQIDLPLDFDELKIDSDFLKIINQRKSHRVFEQGSITLLKLSYLLWSTQGIKYIKGNNYATIRTVPSGGARHEFETYLIIQNVEGLIKGTYHYLPMTHQIEFLKAIDDLPDKIIDSVVGQKWIANAQVIFFWSVIPYRSEWRYSIYAHRDILIDVGHVCQNLYLSTESINLGTCGILAFDRKLCDAFFDLDGKDEFTIYLAPVGIPQKQEQTVDDFYSFVIKNRELLE